jgi:hypothetical protein
MKIFRSYIITSLLLQLIQKFTTLKKHTQIKSPLQQMEIQSQLESEAANTKETLVLSKHKWCRYYRTPD